MDLDILHIYQRPHHIPHSPIHTISLYFLFSSKPTQAGLTEMIKVQDPLPSSLRVPIQNAQSDTSLLACLLDDDRYDVDVSGFSQVLDPDWVGGSGAAKSNQNPIRWYRVVVVVVVVVIGLGVTVPVPVSKNEGFDMMLGDKIGLTRHQA
jgi:hypothetical protein